MTRVSVAQCRDAAVICRANRSAACSPPHRMVRRQSPRCVSPPECHRWSATGVTPLTAPGHFVKAQPPPSLISSLPNREYHDTRAAAAFASVLLTLYSPRATSRAPLQRKYRYRQGTSILIVFPCHRSHATKTRHAGRISPTSLRRHLSPPEMSQSVMWQTLQERQAF